MFFYRPTGSEVDTVVKTLMISGAEQHIMFMKNNERVADFIARHVHAQAKVRGILESLNQAHRMPQEEDLANNLFEGTSGAIRDKIQADFSIMLAAGVTIDLHSPGGIVKAIVQAEANLQTRPSIFDLPKHAPSGKGGKGKGGKGNSDRGEKGGGKGDGDGKGGRGDKISCPVILLDPVDSATISRDATVAGVVLGWTRCARDKCRKNTVCYECSIPDKDGVPQDHPGFPNHAWFNCPFDRLDKKPWASGHQPAKITPGTEIILPIDAPPVKISAPAISKPTPPAEETGSEVSFNLSTGRPAGLSLVRYKYNPPAASSDLNQICLVATKATSWQRTWGLKHQEYAGEHSLEGDGPHQSAVPNDSVNLQSDKQIQEEKEAAAAIAAVAALIRDEGSQTGLCPPPRPVGLTSTQLAPNATPQQTLPSRTKLQRKEVSGSMTTSHTQSTTQQEMGEQAAMAAVAHQKELDEEEQAASPTVAAMAGNTTVPRPTTDNSCGCSRSQCDRVCYHQDKCDCLQSNDATEDETLAWVTAQKGDFEQPVFREPREPWAQKMPQDTVEEIRRLLAYNAIEQLAYYNAAPDRRQHAQIEAWTSGQHEPHTMVFSPLTDEMAQYTEMEAMRFLPITQGFSDPFETATGKAWHFADQEWHGKGYPFAIHEHAVHNNDSIEFQHFGEVNSPDATEWPQEDQSSSAEFDGPSHNEEYDDHPNSRSNSPTDNWREPQPVIWAAQQKRWRQNHRRRSDDEMQSDTQQADDAAKHLAYIWSLEQRTPPFPPGEGGFHLTAPPPSGSRIPPSQFPRMTAHPYWPMHRLFQYDYHDEVYAPAGDPRIMAATQVPQEHQYSAAQGIADLEASYECNNGGSMKGTKFFDATCVLLSGSVQTIIQVDAAEGDGNYTPPKLFMLSLQAVQSCDIITAIAARIQQNDRNMWLATDLHHINDIQIPGGYWLPPMIPGSSSRMNRIRRFDDEVDGPYALPRAISDQIISSALDGDCPLRVDGPFNPFVSLLDDHAHWGLRVCSLIPADEFCKTHSGPRTRKSRHRRKPDTRGPPCPKDCRQGTKRHRDDHDGEGPGGPSQTQHDAGSNAAASGPATQSAEDAGTNPAPTTTPIQAHNASTWRSSRKGKSHILAPAPTCTATPPTKSLSIISSATPRLIAASLIATVMTLMTVALGSNESPTSALAKTIAAIYAVTALACSQYLQAKAAPRSPSTWHKPVIKLTVLMAIFALLLLGDGNSHIQDEQLEDNLSPHRRTITPEWQHAVWAEPTLHHPGHTWVDPTTKHPASRTCPKEHTLRVRISCPNLGPPGHNDATPVGVLNVLDAKGRYHKCGIDTMSDISLVSKDAVDPCWVKTNAREAIHGVGGVSNAHQEVRANITLQWGAPPTEMSLLITDLPPGVDILLGVDVLDLLDTTVDRKDMRVNFGTLGITAPLHTIGELEARSKQPLNVLSACAGTSIPYGAMINMGFRINKWYSIEKNQLCRDVATSIIDDNILTHVAPHDIEEFPADHYIYNVRIDIYMDSCPCQPWSRLRHNPPGFDDPRAEPLRRSMSMYQRLLKINPHMKLIAENVTPHHTLAADTATMSTGWSAPAYEVNAKDWGSASSRPRTIFTNIANLDKIPHSTHIPTTWIVENGFHVEQPWLPCVVSSIKTKNPPMKVHSTQGYTVPLTSEESEKAQGFPPGITARTPHDLEYSQRLGLVGQALNFAFIYNIMKYYAPPGQRPLISLQVMRQEQSTEKSQVPDIDQYANDAELEEFLSTLTEDETLAWVTARKGDFEPPPMHLQLKPECDRPRGKPKHGYAVPDKLKKGLIKAIAEQVDKGYMRQVAFRDEFFVSNGFAKDKGVLDDDGDPKCRLLGDFRDLNECLAPPPSHWRNLCSDISDIGAAIPYGTRYYIKYDFKDAYHQVPLTEAARDLVVVQFGDIGHYQYLGAAQGISTSALFYQPHMNSILSRILGCHWRKWYAGYVDDYASHAMTPKSIATRDKVFRAICKVFRKTLSTKDDIATDDTAFIGPSLPPNVKEDLILGGLHINPNGVRINDEGFTVLEFTLTQYPVRNKSDALHVIGVCNYTRTAFQWDDASSTRYSDLIGILQDAATAPRMKWGEPQLEACANLLEHITKRPLAYCSPDSIIDDDHSIAIHTDASDTSIGYSLFRCKVKDANDITLEMLQNPALSQLISVKSNKLKTSQLSWNTFEAELFAKVKVVETWGPYITQATARFPYDGPKKVVIMGDSTTAISKWTSLHLPTDVVDVLAAKSRRFFSWADNVACTNYWPVVLRHIPGETNCLAHVLSHLGDLCRTRQRELADTSTVISLPVTLHSYHEQLPARAPPTSGDIIPPGHITQHMMLSQENVDEIIRAYKHDDTLFHKVPLSNIYAVVTGDSSIEVPPLVRERINSWIGTQFFSVAIPGLTGSMLYTPASCQVFQWGDDQDPAVNLSKTLVLAVPKGAQVQMTSTDSIVGTQDHVSHHITHYMDHDLRRDLLLATHDLKDHPSRVRTLANLKQLAWWPQMVASVRYHIDSCAHCIPKRNQKAAVGISVLAAKRFTAIQIDHKILTDNQATLTGFPAILSICDCASRQVMFIPATSTSAHVTATLLFIHWYSTYGYPLVIRSDKGSGFASQVFAIFRSLSGVKLWDHSATDNPTHHSLVENKHKVLDDILIQAEQRGDLNPRTLPMMAARAMQVCNFDHKAQGITAFERVTAQPPRTLADAMLLAPTSSTLTLPPDPDGSSLNADFIKDLLAATRDTNEWALAERDEAVRGTVLQRLTSASSKATQSTDLRVGDVVSFHGRRHILQDFLASPPSAPAKCLVCRENHNGSHEESFVAKFTDLYRIADPRPELTVKHIIDPITPDAGDLVFYRSVTSPGDVLAGVVTALHNEVVTIHECIQAEKQDKSFLPAYLYSNGTVQRHRKQPKARGKTPAPTPLTETVPLEALILKGTLSPKFNTDEDTLSAARAAGIMLDLPPELKHDENPKLAMSAIHTAKPPTLSMVALRNNPTCIFPDCDKAPYTGHPFCGKTHARMFYDNNPRLPTPVSTQPATAMGRLLFIMLAIPALFFYISVISITMAFYNGMTININLPDTNAWTEMKDTIYSTSQLSWNAFEAELFAQLR
jgi:site-specific DNA-cytosine methylase